MENIKKKIEKLRQRAIDLEVQASRILMQANKIREEEIPRLERQLQEHSIRT